MEILILGLALIFLVFVVTLVAISKKDIREFKISVIRPWKFTIELKKKNTS